MRSPLKRGSNQEPASSAVSAASEWPVTGPDPSVVRLTASSWMTTRCPSLLKWTSSSMWRAPRANARRTGGEEREGIAPVLETHRLERGSETIRQPLSQYLPGLAPVGAPGDARAGEVALAPRAGALLGRGHEHELRLSRMKHEKIGITADLVLQVGPLLPRRSAVAAHVHADARRDVDAVGVQRVDHRAVDVVVHARDDAKRLAGIGALQEA